MNKYRGEAEIVLGGKRITLLPTFQALVLFEECSGLTIYEACDLIRYRKLPMKALVAVVWSGWMGSAKGDPNAIKEVPTLDQIGEMLVVDSWLKHMPVIVNYLMSSVIDKDAPSGNGEGVSQ